MTACPWPVAQLVPHSGDAIMIDTVDDWDDETLSATAVVRADSLYSDADGSLPAWLGLEIMAQAVGAWAGCQARHQGQEVGLGFLLGTRRYECHVQRFLPGTRLSIRVQQSLRDAIGMGVFECELRAGGELLALARLNVYQPADASAFTREAAPDDDVTPAVDATGNDDAHPLTSSYKNSQTAP
ncbi:MAG TPA: hotdog family protein [Bordetella sp.]|nr:hotdog family protein [Bordetella sp.]